MTMSRGNRKQETNRPGRLTRDSVSRRSLMKGTAALVGSVAASCLEPAVSKPVMFSLRRRRWLPHRNVLIFPLLTLGIDIHFPV